MITKEQYNEIAENIRNMLNKINRACLAQDTKYLGDDFWDFAFNVADDVLDALKNEIGEDAIKPRKVRWVYVNGHKYFKCRRKCCACNNGLCNALTSPCERKDGTCKFYKSSKSN